MVGLGLSANNVSAMSNIRIDLHTHLEFDLMTENGKIRQFARQQ